MKRISNLVAAMFLAALPLLHTASAQKRLNLPTSAHAIPMTPTEQANLDFVLDWWRIVIDAGHLEAVPKYQAEGYIQHNPGISTGRAAFLTAFSDGNKPTNPIPAKPEKPPVLAAGRGDFVWFLWERLRPQSDKNPQSYYANGFELLRVSDGQIQEHWDTAMKDPGAGAIIFGITPKPLPEFNTGVLTDGEKKAQEIAVKAATDVYLRHETTSMASLFAEDYIEHDPNISKIENVSRRAALEAFVKRASSPTALPNLEPALVLVNGEYVFMLWNALSSDPDDKTKTYPWSYFQLLRVHDGKIAEHWDQERDGKNLLN